MRKSLLNSQYKKGDIWISAALYTALGLILITIILSVGMPFVNKIKDRNTVLQTKNILIEMDKTIREVELEGVGSRRPFFVEIQEGDFQIKSDENGGEKIVWAVISDEKLGIEAGESPSDNSIACALDGDLLGKPNSLRGCGPLISEGNLNIQSRRVGQGYEIRIWVDFKANGLNIVSNLRQLSGQYNLVIEHREDYVEIKEG